MIPRKFIPLISCIFFLQNITLAEEKENPITVYSDALSLVRKEAQDVFHFTGNVVVNGPNMHAICNKLDIFSDKTGELQQPMTSFGNIQFILATGNVIITKEGQTAKAGRAEILPAEEKMVLTENPSIIDKDGIVEGDRITLFQNDQKAIVEGGPSGKRPTVTLPEKNLPLPGSTPLALSEEKT